MLGDCCIHTRLCLFDKSISVYKPSVCANAITVNTKRGTFWLHDGGRLCIVFFVENENNTVTEWNCFDIAMNLNGGDFMIGRDGNVIFVDAVSNLYYS